MTYPRSHLVDPEGGIYHVCSRCVRRAFLCGVDGSSGFNFDHRRLWIEERILSLSSLFAIDVMGYAVMSNHYHIVLEVNPKEITALSDDDIIERWLCLNPRKVDSPLVRQSRKLALKEDPERVSVLRERLASLSWFMRYLNEPLARFANKEDGCKGRFWEGRFKSQRLLDEHAVLACMVYVDLNPMRAGISDDLQSAEHTSIKKRLLHTEDHHKPMCFLNDPERALHFSCSLDAYIKLVNWTVDVQQSLRPSLMEGIPPPNQWVNHYLPRPGQWPRALGSLQSIKDYAVDLGQCWVRTARV
jgi:hypothetical protein